MSKSVDNVVKPLNLADVYGVAALRFYLMNGLAPGRDADFDEDVLRTRCQSALRLRCDGLGHEVSATSRNSRSTGRSCPPGRGGR